MVAPAGPAGIELRANGLVFIGCGGILLLPLGSMQLLLAPSGQLTFSELDLISLKQLLFHYDIAHPLSGLMDSLNLTMVWSMFLLVIGFSEPGRVVGVNKIVYRNIKSPVFASGHLLYQEQVLLSPEVIGKVGNHLREGGPTSGQGRPAPQLDNASYRAEVAQPGAAVKQQRIQIEQQQLNRANQENQLKRKT